MKLIIDIPEKVVTAIQNGEDYRFDIHTAIAQGIPCEENQQSSLEKPLYEGVLFVDDYGINKVIEVDEDGTVTAERIVPKDTFIEAYNKFIRENDNEHTDDP